MSNANFKVTSGRLVLRWCRKARFSSAAPSANSPVVTSTPLSRRKAIPRPHDPIVGIFDRNNDVCHPRGYDGGGTGRHPAFVAAGLERYVEGGAASLLPRFRQGDGFCVGGTGAEMGPLTDDLSVGDQIPHPPGGSGRSPPGQRGAQGLGA